MKKTLLSLITCLFLGALLGPVQAINRDDYWGKVRQAIDDGLPRTAMEHLEPILASAMTDEAYAEAARALLQKIALEGTIQGNKPEEKIALLDAEIEQARVEMRPILQAVQAHWHWHFFQQNRWRFMQRTATDETPGDDISAWPLPRIFAEIDARFSAALADTDALQATPIEEFDDLLSAGTMPDRYRPTLYDFIAANALEFYTSGEQAAAHPQDAFVLSADSAIFAGPEEFMRWDPPTTDTASPMYKAVLLYRDLLRFHHAAAHTDALADWDLDRLRFGYNSAVGEEKNTRYQAALRRFEDRYGDHDVVARAIHDRADVLHAEDKLVKAHMVAERGAQRFPDTPGGNQCRTLIERITAPEQSVATERVWNGPDPVLELRYRNLDHVHFRLVAVDFEARLEDEAARWQPERLPRRYVEELLGREPARAWSTDLPATSDFQSRTEVLPVPENVEPGFYALISSFDEEFSDRENQVSATWVWVSDLALILRTASGSPLIEGFVLDALSGEPLEDARVRVWKHDWNHAPQETASVRTDRDGLFRVTGDDRVQHILMAEHDGQVLAATRAVGIRTHRSHTQPDRTVLFTDRAIYRPGQAIRFKGIVVRADQEQDDYEVIANRSVDVELLDVNGERVDQLRLRSNDYGSFSGHFTAPRDRLMGRMQIRVAHPSGSTPIRVEEYKRPTFQVALEAPETAPKLNEGVTVRGTATAYTGAATDGAQVRWRVVREVRWPGWWPRWRLGGQHGASSSQEIDHGVTTTDRSGAFDVTFTARPDLSVSRDGDPSFSYTVYADVTDAAGETRSAQRVINVGYTALRAALSTGDWLEADTPFTVTIRTTTLDGVGQSASGEIELYALEEPDRVHPARLPQRGFRQTGNDEPDRSDPRNWPLGEQVEVYDFTTDPAGQAEQALTLPAGSYRVVLTTQDRFGKPVRAEHPLVVVDPASDRLAWKAPHFFNAPAWTVRPGDTFTALWGSGYDVARAYLEIEHRGKVVQRFWTEPDVTQAQVTQAISESMRGGFTVRATMVRENRAYMEQRRVEVPWDNKELDIVWERFVSKLEPGQQETWTAVIRGPDAERTAAEMVATLYDKSLDAFVPHHWMNRFTVFRRDRSSLSSAFQNTALSLSHVKGRWTRQTWAPITYRSFPREIIGHLWGYRMGRMSGVAADAVDSPLVMRGMIAGRSEGGRPAMDMDSVAMEDLEVVDGSSPVRAPKEEVAEQTPTADSPDLDSVDARTNLEETAFFFPHLVSDDSGEVRMTFTMPEALTEWKFMGFAHDRELRAGSLTGTVVTAKELMVQPNPPRFLREGDELEFTVRVTNQSPTRQTGSVRLTFSDARTGDSMDAALENDDTDQAFDVPSKESRSYSWRIHVPDGMGYLVYRAVGSTDRLSDGEEAYVPVLSRRIFVTESLPLPIRGPETRTVHFEKLLASGASDTLRHKGLTVQMVSNPAWYAVMALPYLMEFPHQCSEQIFNRLYANAVARQIANADPRIRNVFDQWKGTEALDSPLEKNEDLKAVALEETPWVRQARSESQARRNVGILFDENRLDDEAARALFQLSEQQLAGGAWSWFPGGPPNDYITLYITTGFGRMRHLGVKIDAAPAIRALSYLDQWLDRVYRDIKPERRDGNHLSPRIALYLYGRSFFLQDHSIDAAHREAFEFFVEQAQAYWLQLANRQSQAHLAVALHRLGNDDAARGIMRSIRERSVTDPEMGMFWRETEYSWWWYRAPIETQAMMIEAFDEVMNDADAVEECKVWLLKQKQTQDWKTTKATADAVYALLLRGANLLASEELVEVSLGGDVIEPEDVEAGTGFYEKRFTGPEVEPEMGVVTVRKVDEGVAWGSLHWQYLEAVSKITPHQATPLRLEKTLYTREHTARGPVLERVDSPVGVGDELVVRLVLRTDRDMEYVHLKDHRPSGTEPVNVLSRYRYQDGLGYYESTRDTASHFFIDYLPKGTYVFEYSVRVQHRGRYQTGLATIQCMYAPEFNSHSESVELRVGEE